jgi:asparagine synthase (glutamine-hydrolysing)
MCGIFGYIATAPRGNVEDEAESLAKALRHRGPDGYGYEALDAAGTWHSETEVRAGRCSAARVLLGQTRLAIIDLSADGRQPMSSPDGRYRIVFNGEIYNYLELRAELESLGETFRTRTDTEVLLRAYMRWGSEALNRLVGMFAFAIHDGKRGVVFCARDFFGIKPFYCAALPGRFAFASEVNALLRLDGAPRRLDHEASFQFLRYGRVDYGAGTMIEGLQQLPPAHFMEVSPETGKPLRVERYWSIDLERRSDLSFADAAERLQALLMDSVRLHLRSDVTIGVTLSGGIDSSVIACAIRRLEPDMPIRTFSYVADNPELSEERWVDLVNGAIGAEPNKVVLDPEEMIGHLDELITRQGEPFGSTSIYAQARVFQLARERGVVVTLDGQGADELFGGYTGYPKYRALSLFAAGRPSRAIKFMRASASWPGRPGLRAMSLGMVELCTPDFINQAARTIMRKPNVPE